MGTLKKNRASCMIEVKTIELMDYYATGLGCSRAELMRALLNLGIEDSRIMQKIGVPEIKNLKKQGVIVRLPLGYYEKK